MADVAFHFNAPDKRAYACRLVRKAVGQGAKVVVTGSSEVLQQLDVDLWTFSPLEFVPHCRAGADPAMVQGSPVVLAAQVQNMPHQQVLVNLGDAVPTGFEEFARVIEVVSTDAQDRSTARQRWKQYTDLGYTLIRHDLEAQTA
jgi:DNA polymerase III subunit chi